MPLQIEPASLHISPSHFSSRRRRGLAFLAVAPPVAASGRPRHGRRLNPASQSVSLESDPMNSTVHASPVPPAASRHRPPPHPPCLRLLGCRGDKPYIATHGCEPPPVLAAATHIEETEEEDSPVGTPAFVLMAVETRGLPNPTQDQKRQ